MNNKNEEKNGSDDEGEDEEKSDSDDNKGKNNSDDNKDKNKSDEDENNGWDKNEMKKRREEMKLQQSVNKQSGETKLKICTCTIYGNLGCKIDLPKIINEIKTDEIINKISYWKIPKKLFVIKYNNLKCKISPIDNKLTHGIYQENVEVTKILYQKTQISREYSVFIPNNTPSQATYELIRHMKCKITQQNGEIVSSEIERSDKSEIERSDRSDIERNEKEIKPEEIKTKQSETKQSEHGETKQSETKIKYNYKTDDINYQIEDVNNLPILFDKKYERNKTQKKNISYNIVSSLFSDNNTQDSNVKNGTKNEVAKNEVAKNEVANNNETNDNEMNEVAKNETNDNESSNNQANNPKNNKLYSLTYNGYIIIVIVRGTKNFIPANFVIRKEKKAILENILSIKYVTIGNKKYTIFIGYSWICTAKNIPKKIIWMPKKCNRINIPKPFNNQISLGISRQMSDVEKNIPNKIMVKMFKNGTIHFVGCKGMRDARETVKILRGYNNLKIDFSNFKLIKYGMICSKFYIGHTIDKIKIGNIFSGKYNMLIIPSGPKYSGLRIKFPVFIDSEHYELNIVDWLKSINCEECIPKFTELEVTPYKLLRLTQNKLKINFNIGNYEIRKKIIDEIEKLIFFVTIIIFETGQIMITGVKDKKQLKKVYLKIKKIIMNNT
jgi:hypothetical protein